MFLQLRPDLLEPCLWATLISQTPTASQTYCNGAEFLVLGQMESILLHYVKVMLGTDSMSLDVVENI
jgi:hypothetical protein